MGYEFDGVRYEKLRDMRETRRARYVGLFEAGMNFTRTAHAGGAPCSRLRSPWRSWCAAARKRRRGVRAH